MQTLRDEHYRLSHIHHQLIPAVDSAERFVEFCSGLSVDITKLDDMLTKLEEDIQTEARGLEKNLTKAVNARRYTVR